jgi:hypothetical protein
MPIAEKRGHKPFSQLLLTDNRPAHRINDPLHLTPRKADFLF